MDFEYTPKVRDLIERLEAFMETHVYPREREHHDFVSNPANLWKQPPVVEELKVEAQKAGIWNWFLPHEYGEWSPGLTNLEFAPLAEIMGRQPWSFEVFNCSAPDRGNMECSPASARPSSRTSGCARCSPARSAPPTP